MKYDRFSYRLSLLFANKFFSKYSDKKYLRKISN